MCDRLSGLQTGHTIQIETKEEFDKLNSGIGLCCKGRPVVIVDTQRVVSKAPWLKATLASQEKVIGIVAENVCARQQKLASEKYWVI